MCGLVGSYHPSRDGGASPIDVLARMRDTMEHRGPDGAGEWISSNGRCSLGHRRLSIIDLSTNANQPMLTPEGDIALVFNGEIYNHADVRRELEALGKYTFRTDHSDTEMLLYAQEKLRSADGGLKILINGNAVHLQILLHQHHDVFQQFVQLTRLRSVTGIAGVCQHARGDL